MEPDQVRALKNAEIWPDDLRWIRQAFAADWRRYTAADQATIGRTPGHLDHALTMSPRFFFAVNGELIVSATGEPGWKHQISPMLFKHLGA